MRPSPRRPLLAFALAVASALAGPSHAAAPGDPLERFNRRMFAVEETLDRHIFGHVSQGYGSTPTGFRDALRNWARNVGEPVVFVNDVLQGRGGAAARTLARFVVNTTFGLGGFLDVAKKNHLPRHDNDFGATLGRWGVGPGPYLFLPLVGPTTFRDGFGKIADIGLDPLTWIKFEGRTEIGIASTVVDGLSDRVEGAEDLDRIRQTSTDPYATLRSFYLQNRQAEVTGQSVDIKDLPDFDTPPPNPTPPPAAASPKPQTEGASDAGASAAGTATTADEASGNAPGDVADDAPDGSGGEDPA